MYGWEFYGGNMDIICSTQILAAPAAGKQVKSSWHEAMKDEKDDYSV